ncbi:uncharacterized protein LOC133869751 [Alnus glutinosa]|uniref:uncharacterized protein LOC133869751 n=1 Tax=Alnus glutinosa TaxID=3517 RepID=UPI002D765C56|nr:uncharacterized protein LOC133869751 [Alnus glutinosa]XP_062162812.1 uncharacterized protein LOC133869751 [Alnus glutinosa]
MSMDQVIHIPVESSQKNSHNFSDQVECATSKTDRKTREDCQTLYLAALNCMWEIAKRIVSEDRDMLYAKLTKSADTVIHIAVTAKCTNFVKDLLDFMTVEEAAILNDNNDTGLCIAAVSGMMEIAELFVAKNSELTMIRGTRGLTPLGMAAEAGQEKMAQYLYHKTDFSRLNRNERIRLFFLFLSSNLYDLASKILDGDPTMACERDEDHKTALHVLAQKEDMSSRSDGLKIVERCTSSFFYRQASMPRVPHELLESLWKQVLERPNAEILKLIMEPSVVLFDAAKSGNDEFLAVLLRKYPDLLWEVDDNGRSVFHVAVVHRQEHIFNLIYNIGTMKDYIVGNDDKDGNNMLHLAGMLPHVERLGAPRANLQMQRELLWFKEVEKIVRPSQRYMKNSKGKTPREIFIKTHKRLLQGGKEDMKETSNSCMLVATLISTVVFAAALTVPGVSSNITNTPFFSKEQWSMIFILSNAVSLFTSAASIVLLLSLLTSSYTESEFVTSLHARLMFGLTALFFAITTMVLAFIAAIFLIFDYKLVWVPYLLASLASAPVILFLLLHFNLWADLIRSYYWSKFLFQRSKHIIF